MIISRTPLRISFTGGGSDISSYYSKSPGAVVSTSINKYIYIAVNKKFDDKIRASYSTTEIVDSVDKLNHPIIREALIKTGIKGGIEITSISDIPSEGTGLGSSSSFTVGLLNALYAYKGLYASEAKLASEACDIEINKIKSPIGKQDQYIASYGGFKLLNFLSDETVDIKPIIISQGKKIKLENNLLLLYTGISRSANKILSVQKSEMHKNINKWEIMNKMVNLSNIMTEDLNKSNINNFGKILDQSWKLKKSIQNDISSPQIDKWYKIAIENGAIGGKILGAGGGGFLLLYAKKSYHDKITKKLNLKPVPFSFESQGSRIIFIS